MTKVFGILTQKVEVELDHNQLYDAVISAILKRHSELAKIEFIQNGKIMIDDYDDYHNHDPKYTADRDATEEEIDFFKLKKSLRYFLTSGVDDINFNITYKH